MSKLSFALVFILFTSCNQSPEIITEKEIRDSTVNKPSGNLKRDTAVIADRSDTSDGTTTEGIRNVPPHLKSFVTPGYAVLDTTAGDLNLDNYPDLIMVLKKNGEEKSSDVNEHPEKRPLLLLLGQRDKSYKLDKKSDNAVYCIDCGGAMGDPFMDIVIKKGYFSVEHSGGSSWRWNRTTTFKYSPADKGWFLHKDVNESFHASDPGKTETKVHSAKDLGKIAFEKFDVYKENE